MRWVLVVGLAALVTLGCLRQRHSVADLRLELAEREQQQRELFALEERNRQLKSVRPSTEELRRLQMTEDAMIRLRDEVAQTRARLRQPLPALTAQARIQPAPVEIVASEWKRVGFTTPLSTVETALWAAASGEVEELSRT
ncbi:MAG: hypothetical protein ABIV50_10270, partial [Opitutus sp.]